MQKFKTIIILALSLNLSGLIPLTANNCVLAGNLSTNLTNKQYIASASNSPKLDDLWQTGNSDAKLSSNSPSQSHDSDITPNQEDDIRPRNAKTNSNEKLIAIATVNTFETSKFVKGLYWPSVGPFKPNNSDTNTLIDIHNNKLEFNTDKNNGITELRFYFDVDKITNYTMLNLQVIIDFLLEAIGCNVAAISNFNEKFNNIKESLDTFTVKKPLTIALHRYLINISTLPNDDTKTVLISLSSALNNNLEPVLADKNTLLPDSPNKSKSIRHRNFGRKNNSDDSATTQTASKKTKNNKPSTKNVKVAESDDTAKTNTQLAENNDTPKTDTQLSETNQASTSSSKTTETSIGDKTTSENNGLAESSNNDTKTESTQKTTTESGSSNMFTDSTSETKSNDIVLNKIDTQDNSKPDSSSQFSQKSDTTIAMTTDGNAATTKNSVKTPNTSKTEILDTVKSSSSKTDNLKTEFLNLITNWQKAKQTAVKDVNATTLSNFLAQGALKRQQDAINWLKNNHNYYDLKPNGVNLVKYEAIEKNVKYYVYVVISENSKLISDTNKKILSESTDKYNVKYTVQKINNKWYIVDSKVETKQMSKKK